MSERIRTNSSQLDCDLMEDVAWSLKQLEADGLSQYPHDYVAVFEKQVVGNSDDAIQLREECAQRLDIPTSRILIQFKGIWR